jgi:hypothetical protein
LVWFERMMFQVLWKLLFFNYEYWFEWCMLIFLNKIIRKQKSNCTFFHDFYCQFRRYLEKLITVSSFFLVYWKNIDRNKNINVSLSWHIYEKIADEKWWEWWMSMVLECGARSQFTGNSVPKQIHSQFSLDDTIIVRGAGDKIMFL